MYYKELQTGHFIPSGSCSELRYDEDNLHPQCARCNIFLHGNYIPYTLWMQKHYGEIKVEEMIAIKQSQSTYKWTDDRLETKINEYQEKLNNLKSQL